MDTKSVRERHFQTGYFGTEFIVIEEIEGKTVDIRASFLINY